MVIEREKDEGFLVQCSRGGRKSKGEKEREMKMLFFRLPAFFFCFYSLFFFYKLIPQLLDSNKLNPMTQGQPLHHTGDFMPCMVAEAIYILMFQ